MQADRDLEKETINVRKQEAENKKRELELQAQRQDAEVAERSKMNDILMKLLMKKLDE